MANNTGFRLVAGLGTERILIVQKATADLEASLIYINEYGLILSELPYSGSRTQESVMIWNSRRSTTTGTLKPL